MLFVLLHAARLLSARRFGGSRWLAWVTGVVLVSTLWFVGWLGYWLVWDERAQQVALGTARMLDGLPVFADPLSRSFLTDATVNSLLFFVVFFLHMLIPLAMGVALWLHITRLSRPNFLTGRWMTAWVMGSLVLLSALFPADAAGPAKMTAVPEPFAIDAWYLLPLALTDRLGAGVLWAIVLALGALLIPIPWLLARARARVAEVTPERCNACGQCQEDCPYDAIQMVPRPGGGRHATVAQIDSDKCVGCGICAGSCNSAGIGLPWLDVHSERKRVEQLVASSGNKDRMVAFVCGESARASELDGYELVAVPCAGWVHALSVERLLRRGVPGVLIVACGPGSCVYREGPKWTRLRIAGERDPKLRAHKVSPDRVRVLELYRHQGDELAEEARRFREQQAPAATSQRSRRAKIAAGSALAAALALATWAGTRVGYATPQLVEPELVVSFKHPGQNAERCREPSAEELAKVPVHMRQKKICERRRTDVRLRVHVDGRNLVDRAYEPRGIWHDGNSIAIERVAVPEGEHTVRVEVGDSADDAWAHRSEERVRFEAGCRRVVIFDKLSGFRWFE